MKDEAVLTIALALVLVAAYAIVGPPTLANRASIGVWMALAIIFTPWPMLLFGKFSDEPRTPPR